MEEIKGIITRQIFKSTDGFGIFLISRTDEALASNTTIVLKDGKDINVSSQEHRFGGKWVENKRFGRQFEVEYCYEELPKDNEAIIAYLSEYIKGIGEVKARAIVEKFGTELPTIIDQFPERLMEVKGINKSKVDGIVSSWKEKTQLRNISVWLSSKGISPAFARKILKTWEEETINILKDDPYRLVDIEGIGFITADSLAHKILKSIDPEVRLKACLKYCLIETQHKDGNLALPKDKLIEKCKEYIKDGLNMELLEGIITNDKQFVTFNKLIYLEWVYKKEQFIADQLIKRINNENKYKDIIVERQDGIDDSQHEAIKAAFTNNVSIITGSGGTGKTFIAKKIVDIATANNLRINLMCPTGKAAQVLNQKTGHPAETIHKALGINKEKHTPDILCTDIILIDEISMVGLTEISWVIKSIEDSPNTHIVLVGDYQQLPSVSSGNILSDLINSKKINVTFLEKIYRQSEQSYIPIYARDITKGIVPVISKDCNDFYFFPEIDKLAIKESILKLYRSMLSKGVDYKDIQMISPMYKDEIGVIKLNTEVQKILHSEQEQYYPRGDSKFYVGDRVIQLENDYDEMVFNGDTGYITRIDTVDKCVSVLFYNGKEVTYTSKNMQEITLAYASSVHKVQGSQSRYIIFPISVSQYIMLTKELLYTAVTRATDKVFIIGEEKAFKMAVGRSSIKGRHTSLIQMLNS